MSPVKMQASAIIERVNFWLNARGQMHSAQVSMGAHPATGTLVLSCVKETINRYDS